MDLDPGEPLRLDDGFSRYLIRTGYAWTFTTHA
jgi:hypothetical protein